MNIARIFNYFKNKREFWGICILLSASFTMISATNYATNNIRRQYLLSTIDTYPIDFSYETNEFQANHQPIQNYFEKYSPFKIQNNYRVDVLTFSDISIFYNISSGSETLTASDYISQLKIFGLDNHSLDALSNAHNRQFSNFRYGIADLDSNGAINGFLSNFSEYYSNNDIRFQLNPTPENESDSEISIIMSDSNLSNSCNVTGDFDIYNWLKFFEILGIEEFPENIPVVLTSLANLEMLTQIWDDISYSLLSYDCFLFDRTHILSISPLEIEKEINMFEQNLLRKGNIIPSGDFKTWFPWISELDDLNEKSTKFLLISLLFFLPVLIIGIKFIVNTLNFTISKNRREFGLLLVNGMSKSQLFSLYAKFIVLLGFLAGLSGSILGFFLSNGLCSLLFPGISVSIGQYFLVFRSLFILNTLFSIISCIAIGVCVLFVSMLKIFPQEIQDMIHYEDFSKKTNFNQNKFDSYVISISFIVLILFTGFYWNFGHFDFSILSFNQTGLFLIMSLSIPVLFLLPFIFPISFIRYCLKVIPPTFSKVKEKFVRKKANSQKKKKILSKLLFWKFNQRNNRNQKIIHLFALTIILSNLFLSMYTTYQYSDDLNQSLTVANGNLISLNFGEPHPLGDLQQFERNFEGNSTFLEISSFNPIYHSEDRIIMDPRITSLTEQYSISSLNLTTLFSNTMIREDWFANTSLDDLISQFNQEQGIIVPSYLQKYNISLFDQFTISYWNLSGSLLNISGIIVGMYNNFPTFHEKSSITGEMYYSDIIIHPNLISDLLIQSMDQIYYCEEDFTDEELFSLKKLFFDYFPLNFVLISPEMTQNLPSLDMILFNFLKIESYLLVLFSIVGYFILSKLSSSHSLYEIGLLHAKGFSNKDLTKLSILESLIIGALGLIFSCLTLGLTPLFILIIKEFPSISTEIPLYYKFNQNYFLKSIFFGLILLVGMDIWTTKRLLAKIRPKRDLEQVLRIYD